MTTTTRGFSGGRRQRTDGRLSFFDPRSGLRLSAA